MKRMGTFRVPVQVANVDDGSRSERLNALVDTGASHTCIPRDLLDRIGVESEEEWPFILADGRQMMYRMGWARIRIGGRSQPTIVVFGDAGSEPLLGAFTLEGFCLAVDPVAQRLVSVPGLLKRSA